MPEFDTLVTGGLVVTETGAALLDIGIRDGRIAALGQPGALGTAARVLEAGGRVVLPGGIDVHTHFTGSHDRPRDELIGGTLGAAAGGVTTVVEMPHSLPPAADLAGFLAKKALLAETSTVDFGLWGGLTGDNLAELRPMHEAGALAFKAFLCSGDPGGAATDPSGLPRLNDDQLLRAMREIASFDGLIGIHSENHDILIGAKADLIAAGRADMRAHALSGPEIAEIEAVSRVIELARETGVRTHVVHVSSARAAERIAAARAQARITFESCPHYMILDEEDLVRIGPRARCGPPLRPRAVVDALMARVLDGTVDMLASDHCPYLLEQKTVGEGDIWKAGMGLTGVETALPMFLTHAHLEGGLPLVAVAQMIATAPARAFGLYGRKGAIAPGFDADLVLWDLGAERVIRGADLHGLAKWSAFEGMPCRATATCSLSRGVPVWTGPHSQPAPGRGICLEGAAR